MFSISNKNHESTVSGRGASTVALCIFLYMQSCPVTANFYINLTNSPLLLMVTLNQFYLVKGGPGIIALYSFLYLQSCWVTAFGISHCCISLTNLPLLLHGWYKSHQFAALAVHRCHSLGNKQRQQLPKMYVATKVAPILAHQLKSHHSRKKTLKKLKNLSRFPPIKV